MPLVMLPVPPLAAIITGFFLIALPVIVLMTAWTVVTMVRILFPERELPYDPSARRARARQRGQAVPVRFRDLVEDQRHAEAPAMPHRTIPDASSSVDVPNELVDDLWLRRN
ncbi:MAG: hypothetical protein Rubg2KO_00750 [Rubricoccaceae bacterium]